MRTAPKSEELFHRAQSLMPGGVSSPVRAFGSVGGHPIFPARGAGSRVIDVDGNEYVDMLGSWGPLIAGHADTQVVEAIHRAAQAGTSFGAPTEAEIVLAEIITGALPSVQMVRFVSSGTEAAMSALRLARAATGRSKILKFEGCYHGHSDSLLVSAGSGPATLGLPDSPGVTDAARGDTVVCRFNSADSASLAFEIFGADIAAVIVEPVAANMGVVPPQPGFLEALRDLCDTNGALLIFDEVVTGFRAGWQGAQGMFKVRPDLTILGKVIGGGLPVGAYGGSRKLMDMVAPAGPVYQAGTLSGNPLSMAAGIATLRRMAPQAGAESPYALLDRSGQLLSEGLQANAKQSGIPLVVQRIGSMLTAFFTDRQVRDFAGAKSCDVHRFARFFHAMLEQGVLWPPSQFEAVFISTAHSPEDIGKVVEAAGAAFEEIGKDQKNG